MRRSRFSLACLAGLGLSACSHDGPITVQAAPSRSFSIAVGEELVLQIGGVGPSYLSPVIDGSAVTFLGETYPTSGIVTPAGVVQLFHFMGASNGRAVVFFHNPTGSSVLPDVTDTVVVR